MDDVDKDLGRRFFSFSNRISAIEKKTNSIDDQLQIIEADSIEKHKEALKSLRSVKDEMASFGEEIAQFRDLAERMTARLGEFASKESVKVLEKYINMWRPIDFVTRKEVEELIETAKPAKKKVVKKVVKKPAKKKTPQHYSYTL